LVLLARRTASRTPTASATFAGAVRDGVVVGAGWWTGDDQPFDGEKELQHVLGRVQRDGHGDRELVALTEVDAVTRTSRRPLVGGRSSRVNYWRGDEGLWVLPGRELRLTAR
jgi:hypothetical protein